MTLSDNSTQIAEFKKALESLKTAQQLLLEAINNNKDHIELHKALRDSCIQRFEFCIELSWKTSIKLLGLNTKSPNIAIRDMAQNNLIKNPDLWFGLLLARNKTSHTYNEDIAKKVYEDAVRAIPQFEELIKNLERIQR